MFSYYPRAFGRYWLLRRLAEGGMGALHVAATGPPGLEKLCVIKTVLPGKSEGEYGARFADEAQVLLRLSHGNLVPVLDVGHIDGQLYLAMEYVAGKDLRAVWNRCAERRVAFPIDVAVHIVRELLRGLHYAHTVPGIRLVHRDVSPQNVLLSYAGEVKLADFGLSKSTLSQVHTELGLIYGKPQYMSPEQARGQPVDARSDIYAAGIILWEMLTGHPLFAQGSGGGLPARSPEVRMPSEVCGRVPRDLDPLVMLALRTDPAARYTDGESMRGALASWLAQEAPTTDASRVARFLADLYGDEIERERQEDQRRLEDLRARQKQRREVAPQPPRAQLLPGAIIDGRYRLQRIVGEGGMGQVWAAEHVQIRLEVAIKFLTAVHARGKSAVAAFQREAQASSAIRHPGVVSVTDAGQVGDTLYLVMELLKGRTLQEALAQGGRLPLDLALHIAQQAGEALVAAHRAGLLHRDLKPANIFLLAQPGPGPGDGQADGGLPKVKVLDFGIALALVTEERAEEEQTSGGPRSRSRSQGGAGAGETLIAGTPVYMAPEEMQSPGKGDPRADVYALGVVLYEMLAGERPFPGEEFPEDLLRRKLTQAPPPLSGLVPGVPAALSGLIERALRPDPAERPADMREMVDALAAVARALEQAATPPGPAPPAPGPASAPGLAPVSMPPTTAQLWQRVILGAVVGVSLAFTAGIVALWPRGQALGGADLRAAADLRAGAPAPPDLRAPVRDLAPPPDLAPGRAPDLRPGPGPGPIGEARPPCPFREAVAQLQSCRIDLGKGQVQVAQVACQAALCNPRTRCQALAALAEVGLVQGDLRRAVQLGQEAVRCPGGGIDAHLVLGHAYLKAGKPLLARAQYRQVLLIDPENATAREYIERTGQAP